MFDLPRPPECPPGQHSMMTWYGFPGGPRRLCWDCDYEENGDEIDNFYYHGPRYPSDYLPPDEADASDDTPVRFR